MANYNEMTSKELRTICKENGISYNFTKDGVKHTMTKEEMVNALYDFEEKSEVSISIDNTTEQETESVEQVSEDEAERVDINEDTSIEDLIRARKEIDVLIERKTKLVNSAIHSVNDYKTNRDLRSEQYDENWSMYGGVNPYTFTRTRNKERYIEEAEIGTLIAFLDENGKPRTAALVNRSSERKVIKVKTEYEWEFVVPYNNVLWVRRSNKWAYGVYRILKGYNPNGKCGTDNGSEDTTE